jgi:hypothetical protein
MVEQRTAHETTLRLPPPGRPPLLLHLPLLRLADTPRSFSTLDEWIRHRLRMVQLKQWKRGTTIYREMKRLGATEDAARRAAANWHRWWRNSSMLLNTVLPTSYYDRMGVPRLAS